MTTTDHQTVTLPVKVIATLFDYASEAATFADDDTLDTAVSTAAAAVRAAGPGAWSALQDAIAARTPGDLGWLDDAADEGSGTADAV